MGLQCDLVRLHLALEHARSDRGVLGDDGEGVVFGGGFEDHDADVGRLLGAPGEDERTRCKESLVIGKVIADRFGFGWGGVIRHVYSGGFKEADELRHIRHGVLLYRFGLGDGYLQYTKKPALVFSGVIGF